MNRRIDYTVGFNTDTSGLQKIKQDLNSLSRMKLDDLIKINTNATQKDLDSLRNSISIIENALDKSYNFKLDTTNITAFRQELLKSGTSIAQLQQDFNNAGFQGQLAFKQINTELLTNNTRLKESHSLIDSMAKTLSNTLKWSIASSAINSVTSSIRSAWGFTKALDTSLNDIRIVTGKSAEDMDKFAKKANNAAKALGSATKEYSNAALIYYQQGLDEKDVQARTDVTIKAANVTGQSAAEVSEQLTAVWNGYKVVAEEAEVYIDKLSAVAASTAADLEELSEGMSKVASGANAMGVDIDQLTAQLSTIVSVTRQDASSVGTALKTIFARMGDLKVDGVDEFGVSLGDVSGTLKRVGIEVLDQNGNLRDMGKVMEEVAGKWGTWTEAQQQAIAVAMAGKRQYNNLLALFENWDMYETALATSQSSEGTLQKQQNIYMDSLEGHLNQLSVAGEKVYQKLFNSESMKDFIDVLTNATEIFASFVDSIGGGGNLLLSFGAIASRVFQKNISQGITTAWTNLTAYGDNLKDVAAEIQYATELKLSGDDAEAAGQAEMLKLYEEKLKYVNAMSNEEKKIYDRNIQAVEVERDKLNVLKEEEKLLQEQAQNAQLELDKRSIIPKIQKRDEKGHFINEFEYADLNNEVDVTIASDEINKREKLVNSIGGNSSGFLNDINTQTFDQNVESAFDYAGEGETSLSSEISSMEAAQIPLEDLENLKALQQEISTLREEYLDILKQLKDAEDALAEAQKNGGDVEAAQNQVIEQNKKLLSTKKKLKNQSVKAAQESQKVIAKESLALQELNKQIKENPKLLKKNTQEQNKANRALKQAEKEYKKFAKQMKTKAVINNIMGITSGIVQMTSAISSLINIGDIFSDDSLTSGEKFLALVQNLGMNLPMLVGGIGGVVKGFQGLTKAQDLASIAAKAFTKDQMQLMITQGNYSNEQMKGALASVLNKNAEEIKNEEIEDTVKSLNKAQMAQLLANLMSKQAAASNVTQTATETAKGAAMEQTGNKGLLAGLKIQLGFWPILVIGLAIAAVLATIIALFVIFGKKETDLEKANKALAREQEVLATLTDRYKELNEELKNTKDALSALEEKQKMLEDMTVGTKEWTEALRENNLQVLDLLEKYPQLAQYISTDENGVMTISQEGKEAIVEAAQDKADKANAARIFQQTEVLKAKNNVLKQQDLFANAGLTVSLSEEEAAEYSKEGKSYETRTDSNGNVTGYYANIKSIFDIAETEADINEIALGLQNVETYDEAKAFLQQAKTDGLIEDSVAITDDLIKVMFNQKDELYKNTVAMQQNSEAVAQLKEAYAAEFFAESEDRDDAVNASAFDRIAAARIDESVKTASTYATKDSNGNVTNLNDEGKQAYAEAMGVTTADLEYKDGKVKIKGEDDSTAVSITDAAEIAAQHIAATQVNTKRITEVLNTAYTAAESVVGKGAADTLVTIANGQTGQIDTSEVSQEYLTNMGEAKDAMFEQIGKKIGIDDKDLIAKELGFENYAAYEAAYNETGKNIQKTINNATKGAFSEGALKDSITGELKTAYKTVSVDGLKIISDSLNQAFTTGGTQGAQALQSMIESFAGDEETQQKIASVASSINWMDENAASAFQLSLSEVGIEVDTQSDYWQKIILSMENVNHASLSMITNFSKVRGTIQEISDIAKDLSVGDIVSDEDYQKLIKENAELKNSFIMTADGYQFTGSDGDAVMKAALGKYDNIVKTTSEYNRLSGLTQSFINGGWENGVKISSSTATNLQTAYELMQTKDWQSMLEAQGNVSSDAFVSALSLLNDPSADTGSAEYVAARELMEKGLADIDTTIGSFKNGGMAQSYQNSQEVWATMANRTLDEIEKAFESGDISNETFEKAEEYWKNNFASELGFEKGYITSLGAKELEKHLETVRSLELDFMQKMEVQITALGNKIEKAFGMDKIKMLNEQIELQEEAMNIATSQANKAKEAYSALAQDFLLYANNSLGVSSESLMDSNGELDINKLLSLQATYNVESDEYNNIQNIVDLWSNVEDAAANAADAAYSVIDLQIEAFKAQTTLVLEIKKTEAEWRKFINNFSEYVNGSLSVYEEKGAATTIEDAFAEYENQKSIFGTLKDTLTYFDTTTDNYLNNYANYIEAEDEYLSEQLRVTKLKGDITKKQNESTTNSEIDSLKAELMAANSAYNAASSNFILNNEITNDSVEAAKKAWDESKSKLTLTNSAYDVAVNELNSASSAVIEAENSANDSDHDTRVSNAKDKKDNAEIAKNTALSNKQSAESEEIAARNSYNAILANKDLYDKAVKEKEEADQNRINVAKEIADKLGVSYKSDVGYDELYQQINSITTSSSESLNIEIEQLKGELDAANTALSSKLATAQEIAEKIGEDGVYSKIVDGLLVFDEEAFNADFQDYLSQAQESLEEMQSQLQGAYEGYLSAQDELMEIYDKEIEKLSSMNSIIQSSADIWQLVGKNVDGYSTKLNNYYSSMSKNLEQSYVLAQQKLAAAKEEWQKVQEIGDAASAEMIEATQNNLVAATEAVANSATEWMTMITESFSISMDAAIDDFVKKTAGIDLAGVTQDWGIATAEDERYLDEVNATYGINSLMRKFDKSIDSTDNYSAQKKLAEQRTKQEERLNKILEERGKLSQYELDRANAEYELTLKQIALEEAQQTASKMKLTRDASGNYSYQYVSDQDAVAQAQEELEKAQNDLYNLDKERNKELVDEYYNIMSEANDAINEAVVAGDLERAQTLKDMYFDPETGILAGIKQELAAAEENFANIGEVLGGDGWTSNFTKFSQAIKDAKLEEIANSVQTLIDSTGESLQSALGGDLEKGIIGISDGLTVIDNLLSSDGIIGSMVKSEEDLATETLKITNATAQVLEKLPDLTKDIKILADELDRYGQQYQNWLKGQVGNENEALDKNTQATIGLTQAMIAYLDSLDGTQDGSYGTYYQNEEGIYVQTAGVDNK